MVVWEVQGIIIIIIIIMIMTNANTSFHKQATGGKAGGKSRGRACSAATPSFQPHTEVAVWVAARDPISAPGMSGLWTGCAGS